MVLALPTGALARQALGNRRLHPVKEGGRDDYDRQQDTCELPAHHALRDRENRRTAPFYLDAPVNASAEPRGRVIKGPAEASDVTYMRQHRA